MSPITINQIRQLGKLSPSNFKQSLIERKTLLPLRSFLHTTRPFDKGMEPGRGAYNPVGKQLFLRNSCIDARNVSPIPSRYERFVGPVAERARLKPHDILLCKDANVGDACLFLGAGEQDAYFSSGMVRLNFKRDEDRLSCLAMIRSSFFKRQLDALTPRGSTIRHAGELFLDCLIPDLQPTEFALSQGLASAVENIAHCEDLCERKIEEARAIFEQELLSKEYVHSNPRISDIKKEVRVDAGFYSEVVKQIEAAVQSHPGGCATIEEFGFRMKRGPNLQKRDMGRSIQRKTAAPGYHVLVYPSDISERGYIEDISYIGARSIVWHIAEGGVLFSAEGTVGRTFAICSSDLTFITNIHGLIFSPNTGTSLETSAYLCMFFHFMKRIGFFDKVSVGGQGGSFAVGYWEKIKVPRLDESKFHKVASLYSNPVLGLSPKLFDASKLANAGVYELNRFRMECSDYIEKACDDLYGRQ